MEHEVVESSEQAAKKSKAHDENGEHEGRVEDLEQQSLEWLQERAKASGIPDWKQLSRQDLVQRLSESSAPAH